ncbi:MAG: S8 family serine peptidase, partial [Bdellovibrionales bacterium]|nr:S8 family serine peptidase [Bdellovibrionales bacterium]
DSNGGAGSRVLILDTGVDKDHPSLRPNLETGKDFVGDNQDGYPYKDTIGHGSHVAGTIAGFLDSTGFTGVAPRAKFLAGRVCSEQGCSNIAIVEGINWGIEKKVDVISMSLGGAWATPSEQMAVIDANKAGISIVAASGNDGTSSVSFPAALPGCIAVGAVDSNFHKAEFSQYGPELSIVAPGVDVVSSVPLGKGRSASVSFNVGEHPFQQVKSTVFEGSKVISSAESYQIIDAGLGTESDFSGIDAKGKVALIQRGELKFTEKVANAMKAQATGVIIYNNTDGLINGVASEGGTLPIGVFMIEQKVGESIKTALTEGTRVRSTYEVLITNYDSYNGTSMATPHVSGVVALMKAANKNLTPDQIKEILQKTATPLGPNSHNELGAGLINAELAVKSAIGY